MTAAMTVTLESAIRAKNGKPMSSMEAASLFAASTAAVARVRRS